MSVELTVALANVSAGAAQVTVYGLVDTDGVAYPASDNTGPSTSADTCRRLSS
jgi:hypothetical protein